MVKPYFDFEGRCVYSKEGFSLKDIPNNVQHLNNLVVNDIEGFKSHMRCLRPSTQYNSGEQVFYYLGRFKTYYYAQKKFRFHKVDLWLRKMGSTYSINALAGFSPCSDNIAYFANMWLYPNPKNPLQNYHEK